MTSVVPCPTFRDPAGSLSFEDDRVVRTIRASGRDSLLEFLASHLCLRLQQRGDLIGTTIDDSSGQLRLFHPRIPVITYPWEWTPSQWLQAAELTLTLCDEALSEGWILKDATPLNILFIGSRPIFVDVLSFERRDPASSVWLAYGQYMRTFLLPLLMNRLLGWPLTLTLFHRDGYEPVELYTALSWPQRLSRAAFWPITLATWLEKRKRPDAPAAQTSSRTKDPELVTHILRSSFANLRKRTRRAMPKDAASNWSEYKNTLTHYTAEQSAQKLAWMKQVLADLRPERVLDIGANTGEYSAVAAASAEVVALERDAASAERLVCMARARNLNIQTIHADLARPTPPAGWENRESTSLLARLEGQSDLVMMLAVIHHLLLMEQIPLESIIALCHKLTRRSLVIEWVPVGDPMYQSLMRKREDLYGYLTDADLLAACEGLFHLVRRRTLGNGRVLMLFEKVDG
ncbi:MAG: methyltransferase type 12 [Granulicella sp.]